MLEIKYLRQNLSAVTEAMKARGHQADLDAFQRWDEDRRSILQEIETLRHERNVVSDRIAEMKKAGENAEAIVVEMRAVSARIKELDKKLSASQEAIDQFLLVEKASKLPPLAQPALLVIYISTASTAATVKLTVDWATYWSPLLMFKLKPVGPDLSNKKLAETTGEALAASSMP